MRLLDRYVEPERACSYLPEARAQLETLLLDDVSPAELELFLERGFRRFGPAYFRPRCARCAECVSLRIPVEGFVPTRSQKRAARRAARLSRVVGRPVVDDERMELYRKWHAARESARGWSPNEIDAETYAIQFAFPHPSAREVAFREEDGRLVGLGLWDRTPSALSAVFFFSDPERARDSLGVANIVLGVEEARRDGLAHVYLGYRVLGCASLAYKARYGPHELLEERPGFRDVPAWRAAQSEPPRADDADEA
jgi:arginine-tRNA-protein transferase